MNARVINSLKEEEIFSLPPAEKTGLFGPWEDISAEPSAIFFHTMDCSPSGLFTESPGKQGKTDIKQILEYEL